MNYLFTNTCDEYDIRQDGTKQKKHNNMTQLARIDEKYGRKERKERMRECLHAEQGKWNRGW